MLNYINEFINLTLWGKNEFLCISVFAGIDKRRLLRFEKVKQLKSGCVESLIILVILFKQLWWSVGIFYNVIPYSIYFPIVERYRSLSAQLVEAWLSISVVVESLGSNPAWDTFFSRTFYSCIFLFTITVPASQFFVGSDTVLDWPFKTKQTKIIAK